MSMGDPYAQAWGLTGIMGSGKSTAAHLFQAEGAVVLDADLLAREVIDPKSPFYQEVRQKLQTAFPQETLFASDGQLDRQRLAKLSFQKPQTTELLNRSFHPAIEKLFAQKISAIAPAQVIIYDVPLLFENQLERRLKGTIVVWCEEETAIRRALERSQGSLTREQIEARLKRQISINEKRKLADYVLDNSGSIEDLAYQVKKLYQKLITAR